MIAADGQKPIINTNGLALTKEKLVALKRAGVEGFTFHIDSSQQRPHMKGKTELELNELRHHYARMLAEVGGFHVFQRHRVWPHTQGCPRRPGLGPAAHRHRPSPRVHRLSRGPMREGYDYLVGGRKIDMAPIPYAADEEPQVHTMSTDSSRTYDPLTGLPAFGVSQRHRAPRPFQVAADPAHRHEGQDFRLRGPQVHGACADASSPDERNIPRLHEAGGPGRGKSMLLLAPFDKGLTAPPCLSARCRPVTGIAVQETPHAIDHDHPTGGLHQERRSQHVRRVPGHHRVGGQTRLVMPDGRVDKLRRLGAGRSRKRRC